MQFDAMSVVVGTKIAAPSHAPKCSPSKTGGSVISRRHHSGRKQSHRWVDQPIMFGMCDHGVAQKCVGSSCTEGSGHRVMRAKQRGVTPCTNARHRLQKAGVSGSVFVVKIERRDTCVPRSRLGLRLGDAVDDRARRSGNRPL